MATRQKTPTRPVKTVPEISVQRIQLAIQNRFNPIRGLTPEVLSRQLDAFKAGYLRDAALTWDAMEQRDINLKNVASKRKKSVARLPWDILMVEDAPETEAQAQRDALVWFYNNLCVTDVLNQNQRGGLRLLITQMMDAMGKQFAVHEIVWQLASGKADGYVSAELRFVPLWFFENRTGRLRFLESDGAIAGTELDANGWLVTVGEGLMEAASVAYIYKSLPLKDWIAFSEKFGMPGVIGKTDAAKDSAEWNAMSEAVAGLVNDWAAVMNRSSEITLLETKNGGATLPFEPLVEYMDRKVAALFRGADLSTISSGAAEGHGASVQGNETDLILEDDAPWIEETLHEQLTKPVIRYLFGPEAEPLAYLKLQVPKHPNIADDIAAIDACQRHGIPLAIDSSRERLGLPKPDKEDEMLAARPAEVPGHPFGGPGQFANEAVNVQRLAVAFADDLAPLRQRLERILTIEDEDLLRAKLQAFLVGLPKLLSDINADPESARVLEDALQRGFMTGLKGVTP